MRVQRQRTNPEIQDLKLPDPEPRKPLIKFCTCAVECPCSDCGLVIKLDSRAVWVRDAQGKNSTMSHAECWNKRGTV